MEILDLVAFAARRGLLDESSARQAVGPSPTPQDLVSRGLVREEDVAPLVAEYQAYLTKTVRAGGTEILCGKCRGPVAIRGGAVVCDRCGFRIETGRPSGGRYEKRRLLGEGGMGQVWTAWDRELRREVALKLLFGQSPQDLARFRREAHLAAALSHPNIVPVHDFGDGPDGPFLVMDLVPGSSAGAARLGPREAVEVVRQAAAAVHFAHGKGVLHRDLKPENLLVVRGPLRAYVTDFGLAKQLGADSSLSVSGTIFGTPAYMPPEQARGDLDAVGARSDVYSLGATLYALLSGAPPFQGTDAFDVLRKVVEKDPAPLRGPDRDLDVVTMKALSKEPERRYGTAQELADDLGRWLEGESVRARPPSVRYQVARHLRRRPLAAVATAAILILAIAAALFAWRSRESEKRRDVEARERRCQEIFGAVAGRIDGETTVGGSLYYDPLDPFPSKPLMDAELAGMAEEAVAKAAAPGTRFQALYYRGAFHLAAGEDDAARGRLEEAARIEVAQRPILFWILLGVARERTGDVEGAVAAYDEAARQPPPSKAAMALVRAAALLGPAGLSRIDRAIELEPDPGRKVRIRDRIR